MSLAERAELFVEQAARAVFGGFHRSSSKRCVEQSVRAVLSEYHRSLRVA